MLCCDLQDVAPSSICYDQICNMPMYAASLVNESEKELGLVEKKHVLSYREAIARDTDYDENEVGMNEEW